MALNALVDSFQPESEKNAGMIGLIRSFPTHPWIAQLCVCAVSLYGDGYLRVESQDSRSETDILLSFRTSQSTSLLLLAAGTNDFCAVSLDSGAVRVRIDLGSGEASVVTLPGLVFNDLQWHSVRLRRIQATLTLTVDGMYVSNAITPGNFFEVRRPMDVKTCLRFSVFFIKTRFNGFYFANFICLFLEQITYKLCEKFFFDIV